MSPRITIQSGIAAGTSHRIDSRVARVGSDPQSDICLPTADIPGHALTLEFRGEDCLVYNRCRDSVYIGTLVVGPDQVVGWPESDILQLGKDIELALDFDGEETSQFAEDGLDNSEFHGPDEILNGQGESSNDSDRDRVNKSASKTSSSGTRTMIQLLVTGVCIVGCVLLLIRDQSRSTGPETNLEFAEVISNSSANEQVSPELIQRLQYAEAQRVRGRDDAARKAYLSLRNDLISASNETGSRGDRTSDSKTDLDEQILLFIESRLAQ